MYDQVTKHRSPQRHLWTASGTCSKHSQFTRKSRFSMIEEKGHDMGRHQNLQERLILSICVSPSTITNLCVYPFVCNHKNGERSPTSPNTPRARAGPRARGLARARGPEGTPPRNGKWQNKTVTNVPKRNKNNIFSQTISLLDLSMWNLQQFSTRWKDVHEQKLLKS